MPYLGEIIEKSNKATIHGVSGIRHMKKTSPSAPSHSLEEALKKASKIYEAEDCHIAPVDVAAKAMGYKNAKSGSSMKALATLKMFGLLESKGSGMVSITRSFQSYRLVPDERVRRKLLVEFVKKPKIFAKILSTYPDGLPSDETLRHKLVVDMGFVERSAKLVAKGFRQSIEFVDFYTSDISHDIESIENIENIEDIENIEEPDRMDNIDTDSSISESQNTEISTVKTSLPVFAMTHVPDRYDDPISIRLKGGRKVWITLPKPFFSSDKEMVFAHLNLIYTDDGDEGVSAYITTIPLNLP